MARWSKNRVNPDDINNGNEYEVKDRPSREQLNAIVNNSFYASEASAEALEKANSAFSGNGTIVRVDGIAMPFVDLDFVYAVITAGTYSAIRYSYTQFNVTEKLAKGLNITNNLFVAPTNGFYKISFNASIRYDGGGTSGIVVLKNNELVLQSAQTSAEPLNNYGLQTIVELSSGDSISFVFYADNDDEMRVEDNRNSIIIERMA